MGLSTGIVGLPNVGKSTIFNALTAAGALAANYPFATIEPNTGIVPVPDPRLDEIAQHIKTARIVPATIEVVDIAGLVKGASQGEGLGNQFLSHIRAVDALLHVVRCFENPDVVHVDGSVDAVRDVEIIELELVLADLESAERQLEKNKRAAAQRDPEAIQRVAVLEPMVALLKEGRPARLALAGMDAAAQRLAKSLGFITAKPALYVANVDEHDPTGASNPHVARLRDWVAAHNGEMVVLSGAIEAEIAALERAEERREFLAGLGLAESGLNRLARAIYKLLGLQSFFTAGPKEIRAWTIPIGAKAPQAAGVIHSDFERGFIRAEVYTLDDLRTYKTEAAIRAAGKLRLEGKEYVVRDGDIMHFLFNV
ncbi:MAG: redox-regulated ATPase YchF [Chloroflexi bacterium]|jgi:GTP-binding protein YchF|uniref:Ribosome-binding ATPase YchF n=1 Tax=Candidatus Thermofonsia Clade 3 bacterium TaxID=2364212 RepID=A0A2M8QBN8_9CHLR|nr:redox-regulated ATPase YchF [Candidatus Roseilinea sp. NK_OTU-006]PJF47190.1 MAG: redox-regulated ATPase YchF [Candidatus Thermofonsia Clade 3 bacterium]RMG64505.1 MAG: redox-regulated ATPase YchF [Chloroflexota bacterium]